MNLEDKLVQELQKNEKVVHILSAEGLQQEWEARKGQVKTGAGYVSPAMDAATAAKLLREFGISAEMVIMREYAGKQYVIFKGYAGLRQVFKGTRYLATNPKVVRMAVGPKGIAKSVKGGFVVTVVLSVGIEVFDYFVRDTATLPQLLGTVTADLIKIGVSAIAAAVAGLAVGSAAVLGSVAAAPLIAAIAVGVVTGMLLDRIDARFGATQALIRGYEQIGLTLKNMQMEINRTLNYFDRHPEAVYCIFGPCDMIMGY